MWSVGAAAQAETTTTEIAEFDTVVHTLCGKQVALLGESPIHGFGRTLEFKVALVRRLVDTCHYNAFFIESGTYDFIDIQKKLSAGQPVTDAMISAALGGVWANQEVQSLIPFLREKAQAGSLTLGGLDDQLGAGTYAQQQMPTDLVQYLPDDKRAQCLATLQRHTLWQYTDASPYSPADKAKIVGCLHDIQAHIAPTAPWAKEDSTLIDSLQRNFARNFTEDDFAKPDQNLKWINDREQSMYLNFQWWRARLPPHSKIIIWAATVHTANQLNDLDGFKGRVPLGSLIRRDFGSQAFSLGFTAYSGNYAFTHQPVRQLSVAPATSLEAQPFAHRNANTIYLSRKQLRHLGSIAARPLGTSFTTARWDTVLDGLVVFRKERAPKYLHPYR